jgi:hypothetical protein
MLIEMPLQKRFVRDVQNRVVASITDGYNQELNRSNGLK